MKEQSQAMIDLSNQLHNHIEINKSNYQGIQSNIKKLQDDTA